MPLNTRFVHKYAAAFLVALSIAVPVSAGPAEPAGAVDLSRIRIDNFGRIDAHYFRGAQPEGRDYADLASLGIKTVISLTSDDAQANEKSMSESAGLRYFQIPMTTHVVPTEAQLAEFFKIVDDPANQPVYVHCVGGRHRTGVMTAAYRMVQDGWTADQAFKEMKQYKFGADFLHSEFKDFVYQYRPAVAATPAPPATTKTDAPDKSSRESAANAAAPTSLIAPVRHSARRQVVVRTHAGQLGSRRAAGSLAAVRSRA